MNEKEKNLVLRLINDDESAFAELYALYKSRLLYFAMTYVKSREFAEDVFQDAFTAVWQTRHFINPSMSFSTYIYTIVRNRILNLMRSMDYENNLKNYILSQSIDYTDETQETVNENELNELITQALAKCTPKQREVFELSRNQGFSQKEIAEQLNISIPTVKSHIAAALKTLQEYLHKRYGTLSGLLLLLHCLKN